MNAFFSTIVPTIATAPPPAPRELTGGFWLPQASSVNAENIDATFYFITYLGYFFFALIVALMVIFVVKYRQRGREIHAEGPTHHTALEVTWTIIPLLLSILLFYFGFKGFLSASTPPLNSYQIDVTAQQWSWSFKYPNGVVSDDLIVPADKPVKLVMRSEDVLHSLFVPDFRVKKDVVPGRYTTLWFNAPEPTGMDARKAHHLFCTEYCGKDHSNMNRKVYVLNQAEFDEWAEYQRTADQRSPVDERYFRVAPKLYKRCISCHTLDGTPSTGPSWGAHDGLPAIWERTEKGLTKFGDGTTLKDYIGPGKEYETPEAYISDSILNPGKHLVAPFGNAMPTFKGQISDVGIQALIDFMKRLDEFDAKGNYLKPIPPLPQQTADPKKTANAAK
ncbi:MAG: cytochrome c oxidase subunit II [Phycisphaerae bacterium]|nr:cytochrome c oxidase subunit II [Phycisphaerae bacterium]